MTDFREVLRAAGFPQLAEKYRGIRPAPTVDVDHRHGAAVSVNGTWATKVTYIRDVADSYVWGSRKWD